MKKSFKNLAAILSAITLASSLSPVEARNKYTEIFRSKYYPQRLISPLILIQRIRRQRLEQEQARIRWMERAREEQRELERWRQNTINQLQDISFELQQNFAFNYVCGISSGPITPEDIRNSAICFQNDIPGFYMRLSPTIQNIFSSEKFKAIYIIMYVKILIKDCLDSEGKVRNWELIRLLYFLDPEMSQTLDAYCLVVRGHNNKLEIEFISKTQPVRRYIIEVD